MADKEPTALDPRAPATPETPGADSAEPHVERLPPVVVGTVMGGRFLIKQFVGEGGMGAVYLAQDSLTGDDVAVKVLGRLTTAMVRRFAQEAQVLERLSHPAIVRYVAHGIDAEERPFLAMEWLEGEDLEVRLRRQRLTLHETIALGRRMTNALAVVHAGGAVHRDVKPSNVFLVNGDVGASKLLDFGVARADDASQAMTRTGAALGTAGYMAPEQARDSSAVDPRADIFSLGCVLYQCATGRYAFDGENPLTVLAKVLIEEPAAASDVEPSVPQELSDLFARMLAKAPGDRPPTVEDVEAALDAVGASVKSSGAPSVQRASLASSEQVLASLVLVRVEDTSEPSTAAGSSQSSASAESATAAQSIARVAARFGASPAMLKRGLFMIALQGTGIATDQAARSAECALGISEAAPRAKVVLAIGRASSARSISVGPMIDAATQLLDSAEPGRVKLDGVATALLERRYWITNGYLGRDRSPTDAEHQVLGRHVPFVGRGKDLRGLMGAIEGCVEDHESGALLVVAPPGAGKSRLCREVVRRLAPGKARILGAQCRSVGTSAPFWVMRQLVAAMVQRRESRALTRDALDASLQRYAQLDALRVGDFLGELCGLEAREQPSQQLLAAQGDPTIRARWLRQSVVEWLGALAAERPTLLLVDDLHWADPASVDYLTAALTVHRHLPLLLLASARPEVHSTFPSLTEQLPLQETRLRPLSDGAAKQLVEAALGADASPDTVERIVTRAEGNPIYLEELARAPREQSGLQSIPETVVMLAQARLERVEAEARRVLRAASVFGEEFSIDGVAALVDDLDVSGWLQSLIRQDFVAPGAVAGSFTFRHALMLQAAYASWTPDELNAAHLRAAEWLEAASKPDPFAILEHFQRCGVHARALPWLVDAAEQARQAGQWQQTLHLVEQAMALNPEGEVRGKCVMQRADCLCSLRDYGPAFDALMQALPLLPVASSEWFLAAGWAVLVAGNLSHPSRVEPLTRQLLSLPVPAQVSGSWGRALAMAYAGVVYWGPKELRERLTQVLVHGADEAGGDLRCRGWLAFAKLLHALYLGDDPGTALLLSSETQRIGHITGDAQLISFGNVLNRLSNLTCGNCDVEACKRGITSHPPREAAFCATSLATYLLWHEKPQAAIELVTPLLSAGEAALRSAVVNILAEAHQRLGSIDEAVKYNTEGLTAAMPPVQQPPFLARSAQLKLSAGDPRAALETIETGLELAQSVGTWPAALTTLLILKAKCEQALGEREACAHSIGRAQARLQRQLRTVPADLQKAFRDVPEHAETFELFERWARPASPA